MSAPRKTKATRSCGLPDRPQAPGKGRARATFPEAVQGEKRRTAARKTKAGKVIDSPLAVASDGAVVINITHLDLDPLEPGLVARLVEAGHLVLVAIAVPDRLGPELAKNIGDGAADLVGRLGPRVRLRTVRSRR